MGGHARSELFVMRCVGTVAMAGDAGSTTIVYQIAAALCTAMARPTFLRNPSQ